MTTLSEFNRYVASGALNRAANQAIRAAIAKQRTLGLPLDGDEPEDRYMRIANEFRRELQDSLIYQSNGLERLPDEHLRERRKAVDFAIANCELEGGKTPADFRELLEKYAAGEIGMREIELDTEHKFSHR